MKNIIIVAGCDLFFSAKIRGISEITQTEITFTRSIEQTLEKIKELNPVLVVFDLNSSRLDSLMGISKIREQQELQFLPILGFLSHVQVDLREQALAANCTYVVPRSKLLDELRKCLEIKL